MSLDDLDSNLHSTFMLLNRAFDGKPILKIEYFPLLRLLCEEMSMRALAKVIASYQEIDYAFAYNDILRADSSLEEDSSEVLLIKEKLREHGYDEWLLEE